MYNYSPIKTIRVKNFRNIGDVELSFEKSPIITLLGENEAGKTSIIKAFATCALHDNPREQKDYIRDTTNMFGVQIDLQDGTQILRVKEAAGMNLYSVTQPNGEKWSTNKITDGLPKEVQDKMGLIVEPETGEYLQVRTYEDRLLFIVTPASTNYKVMYNALKVEQLTGAIKIGSAEVNSLRANIGTNELSIQTLNTQLRDIKILDIEALTSVKDRLQSNIALLDKLSRAEKLVTRLNELSEQLGALELLNVYNVKAVNELLASKLNSVSRLMICKDSANNLYSKIKEVIDIPNIDTSILNKCRNLTEKIDNLNNLQSRASGLISISKLDEISEIHIEHINKVKKLCEYTARLKDEINSKFEILQCNDISENELNIVDNCIKVISKLQEISDKRTELESANKYIEQIHNYLKACGVAIEACPKCGEAVVFDIDKL